ncbi:MAG: Stage IV sporulation protein FB [Chlamydiae bacterium]|nr:Stage IV sporulation protein FB [Chlamydiota bacterium]
MITIPGKIPITIRPFFWITAALIGFLNSGSLIGTLVWIFVILISVIIHELGHGITAKLFGLQPRIELVALGGLTYHQGDKLPFWKQFIIVLNGPIFGFCLFLVAYGLLKVPSLAAGFMGSVLTLFYWVNLIWTILNLVPVMPLDGGQLLRIALESFFGAKGMRYALVIGMVISGGLSLFFFLYQNFLIGAIFFLFAFQSFDMYRRLKNLAEGDTSHHLKEALRQAELDLQQGRKDQALFAFEKVRNEAGKGMIFLTATQHLAFLKYDLGKEHEVYELLVPHRSHLSSDALCLLHKVAYEEKDFPLVEEIGGSCFQEMPNKDVALRNAYACAALSKDKPAVGWLEAAFQEGLEDLTQVLKGAEFDPIRQSEAYKKFLELHSEG